MNVWICPTSEKYKVLFPDANWIREIVKPEGKIQVKFISELSSNKVLVEYAGRVREIYKFNIVSDTN